nr:IS66 family transposase [Paraburkholderia tropica]
MVLKQQASLLEHQASIAKMVEDLAARDDEIERLKAQIDKLKRMCFGRRSEQLAKQIDKLEAQLEDLTAGRGAAEAHNTADKTPKAPNKAPVREPLPPHLPREEIVLEPDPLCPRCATTMQSLGEDISEQLARAAAAFKVIRTIRRKRVCPNCGYIAQPPMPCLPIERSIAHPSLLADILVSKFADHQPLYRQSEIAARDGVTIDRASMGRWVGQIAALCQPLVEAIQRYTLMPGKVHTDDTPVAVLAPGNGKTSTGRFWVYMRDDRRSGSTDPAAVWFDYSSDRKGVHPQTRLAEFTGILQADAYAGFDKLYANGNVHEAACWDHARRYYYDVHERTPTPDTQKLLEMIGELYGIEAGIRGKPPDERLRVRQEKSKPLLATFESTIRAKLATLSKKSTLTGAINYSLNHWAALTFYCEDGRAEISNILAENALRCVSLGRKNYLFVGSDSGGERAAAMYSLIGTCKLNEINPRAYLEYVLTHIADHRVNRIDELLPWNVADKLPGHDTTPTAPA